MRTHMYGYETHIPAPICIGLGMKTHVPSPVYIGVGITAFGSFVFLGMRTYT